MFADLLLEEIQPREIDVKNIPDIELTESLEYDLQKCWKRKREVFLKYPIKHRLCKRIKIMFSFLINGYIWLFCAKICGVIKTVW